MASGSANPLDPQNLATWLSHALGMTTPDDDFSDLPPTQQDQAVMQGYNTLGTAVGDAVTAPIRNAERAATDGLMVVLAWGGVLAIGALALRKLER